MTDRYVADICAVLATAADPHLAVVEWLTGLPQASGAALLSASPPSWRAITKQPKGTASWPEDLVADAAEAARPVRSGHWLAIPVSAADSASRVAVVCGTSPKEDSWLGEVVPSAVALADQIALQASVARKSQLLLDIIVRWRRTDDLRTLLSNMAEAATQLFACDRATIFLWDRTNKTLVGRPALGMPDGELRIPDDVGVVGKVVATGEMLRVNVDDDHAEVHAGVDEQTGYRTESLLCVPLTADEGETLGAFELLNKQGGRFTSGDEDGLQELARHAAVALAETQQWQRMLTHNEQLLEDAARIDFIGDSPAIAALRRTIVAVADAELAVLLLGENGTGKEVVARALHFASRRSQAPFLAVNCAALSETLLESELFGHEKGAFTDAHATRIGKFEAASGGTLLLDEIGDMSLAGQAKLLRVLEEKIIVRVGGTAPIATDVRVVAATNRDLVQLVRDKRFREDLYYRLNVVTIDMPPLRERGDDILLLAEHFLSHFCRRQGRRVPKLTATARKRLLAHRWPGNVRELRNLMERLAYLAEGDRIDAEELAFVLSPGTTDDWFQPGQPLQEATRQFQIEYIERTIRRLRGNVTEAAKALGMHRSNLYRKMNQLAMNTDESE